MGTLKLNWFDKQVVKFEESRFAMMSFMIVIQTTWGSIAAGLSYSNDTVITLIICTMFSAMNNAVLISQGPARWCVGIFSAATVVNTVIIIIELFAL